MEDEEHFMFKCKKLHEVRKAVLSEYRDFSDEERVYTSEENLELLSTLLDTQHIKQFGCILEAMVLARRSILYK